MQWSMRVFALAAVVNANFLQQSHSEAVKKAVAESSGSTVAEKAVVELPSTTELLWGRLVDDVKRTRIKLKRLHGRITTLNTRMDDVLNRTGSTQPLVLSFYDQAITTGTLAEMNNITINTIQPKLAASVAPFATDQAALAESKEKLTSSDSSLPSLPELVAEHDKLIKMGVKLDEVTPAIDRFQGMAAPIESYLKLPYETLLKRSMDEGVNAMIGDLTTVMASHLEQAEKDTDDAA